MPRFCAFVVAAVLCGAVVVVPGCMSYRTGGLKDVDFGGQADDASSKPSALVEIVCQTREFTRNAYGDNMAAAQSFRGVVAGVFADSRWFGAYTFNPMRGTNMDMRIVFRLKHQQRGSAVGLVLSAATLCVLPFTGSDDYQLSVQLFRKDGTEAWSGVVADSMRTWIQLLLFPLGSSKSEDKVRKQLLDNLVRSALLQMKVAGHLSPSP